MILSDRDIKKALQNKRITFKPTLDLTTQLGSCSIDLRLGTTFRVFKHSRFAFIDPHDKKLAESMMEEQIVKMGEAFILQPGDFVLATTIESFTLPNDLLARLEGRSSLGRLGIVVHSTASIFEPGWDGVVVMELGNMGRMPVALYPTMRICALTFEELTSDVDVPYNQKKHAKYIKQTAPLASKIAEEE
ncbi:MAG: Deoxycytidine triphosphate deaminase [Candidatus Gottesmanbacteria bacterium GW2011_GWC1_43_10]|nr:MAG: Deoxycytidine triphosphate deaminase [Candidatus Gottesmanbacteria bacterium GW2011_GWA1_42_26]KKS80725.1 MAG: Deoxycytidine triphosphate deaminase [Candidatus Gottesmanbacteria bacterium GW2011_GWC1_43_10]OGG10687.1 MAG: dCTP deaminase [Candidatus Gottesmanbacteria bacterium RIFCSPHIGHO2_01_FULL_43_15]OGG25241.1 MAG: dCTP deaminase [Candidatus Gottesmanbacteria bacterium RIFCSPLOWO2_01_FULL_42_10]HCM37751.1 dCTP deaminase [Patescibacteria group bacterium]